MHRAHQGRSTLDASVKAAAALQCVASPTLLQPRQGLAGATLVDPRALDPATRERLVEELFACTGKERDAETLQRFAASLLPVRATRSVLSVYRDEAGFAVGCLAFHEQEVDTGGASGLALRGAVHLPEHLRSPEVGAFFLGQAARALLRARGRPLYIVQALADPAAYAWLYRVTDRVWPSPARQTPAAIESLREHLVPQLGLGEALGSAEIRRVGTALTASSARRWRRHPRPEVHYFVGRNPGFDRGHGLLTVVPLSAGGIVRAYLRSRLLSLFGGLLGRQQAPSLPTADRQHRYGRRR